MIATASAVVRVLETVRRYYRIKGVSPSYREIAALCGVSIGRIGRYLDQLQAQGYLTHTSRERSIVLVDRGACLSDVELEAACHGRSWTIVKPPVAVAVLGEIFQADTNCPADMAAIFRQLRSAPAHPGAGAGSGDGQAQAQDQEGVGRHGGGAA